MRLLKVLNRPGCVAFQQPGHRGTVQARAQDTFQAGVELGEQAANPVGGAGRLGRGFLVEADQRLYPRPDQRNYQLLA